MEAILGVRTAEFPISLTAHNSTNMIIGIGGISRSGKTKFSRKVSKWFRDQGKTVQVLHQDDFVRPESEIPLIRDHIDWEVPESLDWSKWDAAIRKAQGEAEVVIAEGLMVFREKDSEIHFDRKVLVDISEETFFARKREDLRWGKEPEWYIQYIWDSYLIYGKPEGFEGLLISGERKVEEEVWRSYLKH